MRVALQRKRCAQALRDSEPNTQVGTDLLVQLGNTLRRRFAVRADAADLDGLPRRCHRHA